MPNDNDLNNSMLAFSGGKDSVAVSQYILRQGYKPLHVAVVSKTLDYPQHKQFIQEYCDRYKIPLRFQYRPKFGEYIHVYQRPEFIFPECSKVKNKWFQGMQRSGIAAATKRFSPEAVIYGRRSADGNSSSIKLVRDESGNGASYVSSTNTPQLFPLWFWSQVKTADYVSDTMRSPIYDTARGIKRGTHTINIANMYGESDHTASMEFIKSMDAKCYERACQLFDRRERYRNLLSRL